MHVIPKPLHLLVVQQVLADERAEHVAARSQLGLEAGQRVLPLRGQGEERGGGELHSFLDLIYY